MLAERMNSSVEPLAVHSTGNEGTVISFANYAKEKYGIVYDQPVSSPDDMAEKSILSLLDSEEREDNTGKTRRTDSIYKSNGVRKARAADPIRDIEQIKAMQEYYLSQDKLRNYLIITMGIAFGVRGSDLMKLTIGDVFNMDGSVKDVVEIVEKKNRKYNHFSLRDEKCRKYLEQYLESRQDKGPVFPNDPLFLSPKPDEFGNLQPLSTRQADRIIKEAAKACNVPGNISTHSMRKTFAYQTIKTHPGNTDVYNMLQYMLNHDNITTTYRYCGITEDNIMDLRQDIWNIL